ncbi:MAG: DUF4340 domain-containing protein, partial [Verrucomicrobiota bacterium]
MRPSRTTIVLLLANLAAFALVWKATSSHRAPATERLQIFPADPERVTVADGEQRLALERQSGVWKVTEPYRWQANVWAVQRLVDELRFISPDAGFPVDESDAQGLAAYGLDRPRWTVSVKGAASMTIEAKAGIQPSTRNLFLLSDGGKTGGGKRVVPLAEAMASVLSAKPESYRVDKVFEVADFEARAVSVKSASGEAVSMLSEARARPGRNQTGPEWRFETPFDALADQDSSVRAVSE